VTVAAGAPPAGALSRLSSWVDPETDVAYQHLVYAARGTGHVHELYFRLGCGPWSDSDLTTAAGVPLQSGSTPTGWFTSWIDTFQHVAYTSDDGHVHELYFLLGEGPWQHGDLTAATHAPTATAASELTSWWDAAYQHVAYVSADGHLHE